MPNIFQNDLQFVKENHGMYLDLSFNNIEIVHIDKTVRKNRKLYYLDLKGKTLLFNTDKLILFYLKEIQ